MKKTYSKPEIMFESFTMSTNIAAGCEKIFGLYARGSCGIPTSTPGVIIFNSGDCTDPGGDEATYNGLCYHVPTEGDNLFNS